MESMETHLRQQIVLPSKVLVGVREKVRLTQRLKGVEL